MAKKGKKRRFRKFFIFLFFCFLIYSGICWSFSDQILVPHTSSEKSLERLANDGLDYEKIMKELPQPQDFEVYSIDSTLIKGWYFQQDSAAECAVVLSHGWTATRISMLRYYDLFDECDCDIVMYDHRAHGESSGIFATGGVLEREDLITVTNWLSNKTELPMSKIGWLGVSWGGATVLQAGSIEKNIGFIVADAPFQDWKSAITERALVDYGKWVDFFSPMVFTIVNWRTGIDYKNANSARLAADIEAPVLLIHSKDDSQTASTQSVNISKNLNKNSVFHHLNWGSDHSKDITQNKERYALLVSEFLEKKVGNIGTCADY